MPPARNLLKDLRWKLAALISAYVLWMVVVEEKQALRQLEVPVRFENHDQGVALLGERPASVSVRVRAAEGIVKDLEPPDVDVVVDLTGLGEGRHSIRLRPESPAIIPRRVGVTVIEVFPTRLDVTLEASQSKRVPVEHTITGTPAEGFEVATVTVTPPTVQITGPRTSVRTTRAAVTTEISVANLRAPIEQVVGVEVDSPDVLVMDQREVKVTVDIVERMGERVLDEVPIKPLRGKYQAAIRPGTVTLTLQGPEKLLTRLVDADIVTSVDVKGLAPRLEPYHVPVRVEFTREPYRRHVRVTAVSTESVAVRIGPHKLAGSTADGG